MKGDLEGIAAVLALPFNGTKQELTSRIKNHLDAHPELQANNRFAGLYASTS